MSLHHPNAPRCHHVKTNGVRCGSPAMRNQKLCYFHHIASNNKNRPSRTDLPNLEDGTAIQLGLARVIQQVMMGTIEYRAAQIILDAYRLAFRNLKNMHDPYYKEAITVDPAYDPENAGNVTEPVPYEEEMELTAEGAFHQSNIPNHDNAEQDIESTLDQAAQPRALVSDDYAISSSGSLEKRETRNEQPPLNEQPLLEAKTFEQMSEQEREAFIMRNSGNKAYFMKEEDMPPASPDSGDDLMSELLTMTKFLSKRATG